MAKKKRVEKTEPFFKLGLQEETKYAVLSVVFCVVGIFLLLAAFVQAGIVGEKIFSFSSTLLGVGYYLLPTLAFILAIGYFKTEKANFALTNVVGSLLFIASGLGIIEVLFPQKAGYFGIWIAHPLVYLFATSGAMVALIALFLISILVLSNTHPLSVINAWRERRAEKMAARTLAQEDVNASVAAVEEKQAHEMPMETPQEKNANTPEEKKDGGLFSFKKKKPDGEPEFSPLFASVAGDYIPPPLSIFSKDSGKPGVGDIKANANIIKRTLQNFGIDVAMDEISIGPSVTRYAMKPAEGVRLSKILGLQKNLELALAAHPVRIEAPIPGKALVGIEVPNSAKTTVGLGNLLSTEEYTASQHRLLMTLGRDVDGQAVFANLAKMPHMLIAGTTGSGKSVTIHALVNSLLFRNGPNAMRFVMIDPKRVELTLYNGIPHLLTPVITDPKKAILGLKWLVKEMERRYNVLEEHKVRDISSYHNSIVSPAIEKYKGADEELAIDMPETMPYIVVVIDELADIMSTYPRELEAGIVRLAQMSRAVGIHLILSTQRPSVNVITGLIKANIPARIAMQVSSQIDSRTILDTSGAEKLLGAGDMLFMSGDMGKPRRIQSAFISEDEVKKVSEFLKKHDNGNAETELTLDLDTSHSSDGGGFGDEDEIDDDLFEDARETVVHAGKASTSYLQRKLRIGYSRAARLMDVLEERGVIGPADGSKPRDVLVGKPSETNGNDGTV
ncbi:DNA translocase FtsK 4TM domain-containing protein [Candidatus Campbellbacteria bacterium]|nr:MAG: DNA translocase FtsK 4TM domain-containing protein [Candidatus Campbellbacteria bacterium]